MQRKIFTFIIFLSFILIGTVMGNNLPANQETETSEYDNVLIKEFPVALQCWTFRKFSFMETLDKAKELGIKYLEAYPGQKFNSDGTGTFNVGMTKDEMTQAKNKLKELGITLKLFGVAGFEDEDSGRKLFEFAKEMGIETIVLEPEYDMFLLVDKLANEYRINVAIHNHPNPTKYWNPGITYFYIHNLSPRIGICGDTGHWTRSGIVPTEALKLFKGRIFDIHLKDLSEFGNKEAYDVPFGQGKSDIKNILAELSNQNYHGTITVEHEKEEDSMNPSPAIKEGLSYIKKITYYEGYKELLGYWDGKFNKHGWNQYGPGYFDLDEKSGVLTSSGGMGLMWYSSKMFGNFVLDLDFMSHAPNTNSGVFLRVPNFVISDDYIYNSFEIQIYDADSLSIHGTGAVYDAEPAKLNVVNPTGEWNHYRITFQDDWIKVELNGQLVNNWKAEPRGKIKKFSKEGYIGLQNHDSNARVSFKNIFIKEIK